MAATSDTGYLNPAYLARSRGKSYLSTAAAPQPPATMGGPGPVPALPALPHIAPISFPLPFGSPGGMPGGAPGGQPPAGPGGGSIWDQLVRGFLAAGRGDLARTVPSSAFHRWIGAESGGVPWVVSPANNHGMPNGGLFQFWYGHPWAQQYFQGNRFTASPYQQAMLAARYFPHLDPGDINRYAAQIAAGTYRGWG